MRTATLFCIPALFLGTTLLGKEIEGLKPLAKGNKAAHRESAGCAPPVTKTDLNINNVRTTIFTGGDMWWDLQGAPRYEIPKNSGKHSLFGGSVWIGGLDAGKQLRVAAQTYRQNGKLDWWSGPLDSAAEITASECQSYDRHFRITKAEVQNFVTYGTHTPAIDNWPGNGDVSKGQSQYLAPFFDSNADGIYDPFAGDYPKYNLSGTAPSDCNGYIHGDQTLWWVFNDKGNVHTATGTQGIGLEVHAQAFSFNAANEVNNMTFYQYKIINKSAENLDSVYFGVWTDPDLGKYNDDYVGCDVSRGLGYCYNGDNNDDGPTGYGMTPPAIGVDFFQGPLADPGDGIDNDRDGITDETGEEIIMSSFVYFNNDATVMGNPVAGADYYNYMKSTWKDRTRMTYGGNGKGAGPGATSQPCSFMFPGTTDPAFSNAWSEETAGNVPADRRCIQAAGKFTLSAGAVNYITTGVVWARATSGDQKASLQKLLEADDIAQQLFESCFTNVMVGVRQPEKELSVTISPNPFAEKAVLTLARETGKTYHVEIYNITGKKVREYRNVTDRLLIEKNDLHPGIYFLDVRDGKKSVKTSKILIQ